jgi:hypothetical protein
MGPVRLRLHYRILIPFALVALVATAATAYVALLVAVRAVESRVQGQILNAAMLVSQGDFSSNATILRSVKSISGADVISFDASGSVLASTIDRPDDPLVRTVIDGALKGPAIDDEGAVLRQNRMRRPVLRRLSPRAAELGHDRRRGSRPPRNSGQQPGRSAGPSSSPRS